MKKLRAKVGDVLFERFRVTKFIAQGGGGQVYEVVDITTQERLAIKLGDRYASSIPREYSVSQDLLRVGGSTYIRERFVEGRLVGMTMDLLGRDLADYPQDYHSKYFKAIAIHLLTHIRDFHSAGYIHNDIKPSNSIVTHKGLMIIDYGMASTYMKSCGPINTRHIDETGGLPLSGGTLYYTSRRAMKGSQTGRVDDLECIGYTLAALAGILPGITGKWGGDLQEAIESRTLFINTVTHPELRRYFDEISKIGFKEEPNYDKLITIFQ